MLFITGTIVLAAANRLTSEQRAIFFLTPYQQAVLIGIMLGDAWIIVRGQIVLSARLGFAQSIIHREFFNAVFTVFSSFCTIGYVPHAKAFVRTGYTAVTNSLTFITMQLPCFLPFHNMFYVDNKKIVPFAIYDLLTEVGLAFWIMSDGSRQGIGLHLNVYSFDLESVNRLLHVLRVKFDLTCTIHKHKAGPRIYIHKRSIPHLRSLVTSHMVPNIVYKLGLPCVSMDIV